MDLVRAATLLAAEQRFAHSSVTAHGHLLRLLAGGVPAGGVIGETGTGCGVGLAWLTEGAPDGVRLVSIERDPERSAAAKALFEGRRNVTVHTGDWRDLREHGPFDLLSLDGGGHGKTPNAGFAEPGDWLKPGGTVVIDDFTPTTDWPPRHAGEVDHARLRWLDHPHLHATQIRLAPDLAVVIGTRRS
ncbi:Predicted O-methyltransferase YrrM [Asanoa hainanensis]|uniref:Predicted O-methyltransferase YrrM n=1 Tax=Asanoa hainanensis TaxID=560556 RepID=A0A239FRC6_9ACTN|nr:class I SAM-dependent methyltransferase [Asanoa hainanensis]SNS59461.1 Predicted O-methyltransferase YrrM [Asanoa hainanensis]